MHKKCIGVKHYVLHPNRLRKRRKNLTKFDLNGIIKILQIKKKKDGSVKFKMKGYLDQNIFPEDKLHTTCSKKVEMVLDKNEVLDWTCSYTNLRHATNYLIQLFYRSEQRFSCTRTKIGKLLSIVAFKYARKSIRLFDEDICKYQQCGTAINELKLLLERDIYIQEDYEDSKNRVDCSNLKDNLDCIPSLYLEIGALDPNVKKTIEDVFCRFGAYSPLDLGNGLCDLVFYKDVTQDNDVIDLYKIQEIDPEEFNRERCGITTDLGIINYIFEV